jgi:hypothetical protein
MAVQRGWSWAGRGCGFIGDTRVSQRFRLAAVQQKLIVIVGILLIPELHSYTKSLCAISSPRMGLFRHDPEL